MALRQGRGTGAVRCQVLLHEPEIDVFEMMLCKHAPSQAVDELVGHDEHYEYDGEQQTLLGRRPQQRHGILPDADVQVVPLVALPDEGFAGLLKDVQASLLART